MTTQNRTNLTSDVNTNLASTSDITAAELRTELIDMIDSMILAEDVGADFIDTITDIAAALKSGADGTLVTGTAGTNGNLVSWNADGDAVDSSVVAANVLVSGGALGTPSSGVGTNLTGTAAGLTAGNVTNNANLTGHVTSTGNAAVLGSFTTAQLNAAISDGTINTPEGTAVLSTGEAGGTKFLREDGDGTCSWQAVSGGGDALVANPLSQFAATTSAQLAGVLSDETGSGAAVFATSPTLVTPAIGTATADGVYFTERADHVKTPAAGSGELWLSNDATQKLYLTDDAGTDKEVAFVTGGSDLSAYTGVLGLNSGTAVDVNTKALLEARLTDVADIAEADGDVYTGTHDFGGADDLEIPNSATPTVDTDGQVAIDTTVTDFSHGIMKYYGGEEMGVLAMPIAQFTTPTDGYVPAYNATNDEFELVANSGAGLSNVVEDTTPQLGGQLDVNGNGLGDGTLELLTFTETGSAVNHVNLTNAATGNGPTVSAAGDDTNIDLVLAGKGTGTVKGASIAIPIAISDETTALTTGTAKLTYYMPAAFTLTDIHACVTTAPTGATLIIDVNDGGTSIMTTNKLVIDVSENDTTTAATAPTLTDTALAAGAAITFDIDQVGSTIAGAGAKVTLIGYWT